MKKVKGKVSTLLKDFSGLIASFMIALFAMMLSGFHASLDPLVLSTILGMLISNMLAKRELLIRGIDIMLRLFLPIGIALYGSQLNLSNGLDIKKWIIIPTTVLATFLLTTIISRSFGLSKRLSILLASGLSICGASAIAIVSPLVKARKEETSISVIATMIIGLTAVIFYPLLKDLLSLDSNDFTLLTGITVPMMGQVKIIAIQLAGQEGLNEAIRYKLLRVSMLLFLVVGTIILFKERKKGINLPWFMFIFMALAMIVNFGKWFTDLRHVLQPWSSFFLSSGLAAIGLSVDFESITVEGTKPLIAAVLSWFIILVGISVFLRFMNV